MRICDVRLPDRRYSQFCCYRKWIDTFWPIGIERPVSKSEGVGKKREAWPEELEWWSVSLRATFLRWPLVRDTWRSFGDESRRPKPHQRDLRVDLESESDRNPLALSYCSVCDSRASLNDLEKLGDVLEWALTVLSAELCRKDEDIRFFPLSMP